MRTSLLLVATAAAVVFAVATPVMAVTGGWFPIGNPNAPHVQEVGGWAVAEHVREANDGLKFVKVVSGEVQIVKGVNFRLVIDALNPDGKNARYKAAVYEQDGTNARKLLSFAQAAN
ncbi:hypothetical protein ACP70R_016686 [Stipagrostis hirtigluma subsp. patula]